MNCSLNLALHVEGMACLLTGQNKCMARLHGADLITKQISTELVIWYQKIFVHNEGTNKKTGNMIVIYLRSLCKHFDDRVIEILGMKFNLNYTTLGCTLQQRPETWNSQAELGLLRKGSSILVFFLAVQEGMLSYNTVILSKSHLPIIASY